MPCYDSWLWPPSGAPGPQQPGKHQIPSIHRTLWRAPRLWGSWFSRKDCMFQAHASRNLHKTLRFHVSEHSISNILIINIILCLMPRIILEKRIKAIIPLGYALAWIFLWTLHSLYLLHNVFYPPPCHVQNCSKHTAAIVSITLPTCLYHLDYPVQKGSG